MDQSIHLNSINTCRTIHYKQDIIDFFITNYVQSVDF